MVASNNNHRKNIYAKINKDLNYSNYKKYINNDYSSRNIIRPSINRLITSISTSTTTTKNTVITSKLIVTKKKKKKLNKTAQNYINYNQVTPYVKFYYNDEYRYPNYKSKLISQMDQKQLQLQNRIEIYKRLINNYKAREKARKKRIKNRMNRNRSYKDRNIKIRYKKLIKRNKDNIYQMLQNKYRRRRRMKERNRRHRLKVNKNPKQRRARRQRARKRQRKYKMKKRDKKIQQLKQKNNERIINSSDKIKSIDIFE